MKVRHRVKRPAGVAENQIPRRGSAQPHQLTAMLRLAFGSSWTRSCLGLHKSLFSLSRNFHGNEARPGLPKPPNISKLVTEEDTEEARTWVTQFANAKVPKESVEFSFSRSSGPGGQVIGHI